jgi:hypothetical protein
MPGWVAEQTRLVPPLPVQNKHRFWRLFVDNTVGASTFTTITEVEFRTVSGGPDITQVQGSSYGTAHGRPIFSSEGIGNWASLVFDNDISGSCWAGLGTANEWIGYLFADPVEVTEVAYFVNGLAGSSLARAPDSYGLEYSDDGVNWVRIAETIADYTGGLATWQVLTMGL